MSDNPQIEQPVEEAQDAGASPEANITEELRLLGKNLVDLLRSAWDNPERKRLQGEIENGITELGKTLKTEAEAMVSSPTAQRVKTEVGEVGERIRTGEAQAKVRQELFDALKTANDELGKIIEKWHTSPAGQATVDAEAVDAEPVDSQEEK
jgi:hypothetical protein